MKFSKINHCIKDIEQRSISTGGFCEQVGGPNRPDSTAWAVLALVKAGVKTQIIDSGRLSLAAAQLQDGRVSFLDATKAFWPTPLAILAWHGSIKYQEAKSVAGKFLLETTGRHAKSGGDFPGSHDTSIQGWPWIEDTHSFVDSTALTLAALEAAGYTEHPRFKEGIRLLMDRQLPSGGWNCVPIVYGLELYPFIDMTGVALSALAGHVGKKDVNKSILFLQSRIAGCRTPLSLGWALFGLGGWGKFPSNGRNWIEESLNRQNIYGKYGTTLLSLLTLAFFSNGDFRKCIE